MFLVINPAGMALNLDVAGEIADYPSEQEGGPSRLLVVISGENYTVYGYSLNDLVQGQIQGATWVSRRWIRGCRPSIPGQIDPKNTHISGLPGEQS